MIEMKIMRNQVIRKLTGFNFLLFTMGSLLVTRKAAMAYGPGGFRTAPITRADGVDISSGIFSQYSATDKLKKQKELMQFQSKFEPKDPWRSMPDITGNTSSNAVYYAKGGGWVHFVGTVMQVLPDGIVVDGRFGQVGVLENQGQYFILNLPYKVADGEQFVFEEKWSALASGSKSIGGHTLRSLDYGTPSPPPPEFIAAMNAKAAMELAKIKHSQSNAVMWLMPQATNGSSSAQYSLALHYLSGTGCETNANLALFWLEKAASQGSLEASNKLFQIRQDVSGKPVP